MTIKRKYLVRQKLYGLAMIVLSVIMTILLDGDGTFALVFGLPLGGTLLFTKKLWIGVDDYYWEVREALEEQRGRRS